MFNVTGTNVSITRGDSATLHVDLTNADGTAYTPLSGDSVVLTVKEDANETDALLTLTADSDMTFHFLPTDTDGMAYGSYKYDIQLTTGSNGYTVIPVATFTVMDEITWGDPATRPIPVIGVSENALDRTYAEIRELAGSGQELSPVIVYFAYYNTAGTVTALNDEQFRVSVKLNNNTLLFYAETADSYPVMGI